MDVPDIDSLRPPATHPGDEAQAGLSLIDILTWLGEGKRLVAVVTAVAAVLALAIALVLPPVYTAQTALLPPASQQQGSSALAALGALSGLAGAAGGSLAKAPDELYIALLKSDSVLRGLDERFRLRDRYKLDTHEALRRSISAFVHIGADKKSGVITVAVDDRDPKFAADLANGHYEELGKVLSRLAVSEAQQRRMFYDQQLKETKEHLVKAEQDLQRVQEKSGLIVLDKQTEALIGGAAQLRALIAEREVQLKVLRTAATEQNPDVVRLTSELAALRSELARMESRRDGNTPSVVDMPVGRIPAAAIDYVRARRELKIQETILEGMLRQYEAAKLDEAKEGPALQLVDRALPPDYKSKPARAVIVITITLLALLGSMVYVVWGRYAAHTKAADPEMAQAWQSLRRAWRVRR